MRHPSVHLGPGLALILLAFITLAIDWRIAQTWAWPDVLILAWFLATCLLAGGLFWRGWSELAAAAACLSLYGIPILAGMVRWHLHPAGTALIGDGALQTQLAGNFLLHGQDPYGADYAAAGLNQAPWGEPFPSPALHHLVTFPGQFLIPLPLQAAAQALFSWWDERIALLLAGAGIWLCVRALLPGSVALAAAAFFLLPGHSLIAVLGDNDLVMVAMLLAALLAADRRRPLLMGALLGLAVAVKQDAAVAAPVVCLWALSRGVPVRLLGAAAGVGVAVLAALVIPFLAWNPGAFFQDTVLFVAGGGTAAYPINGFGLSAILLHAGVIHGQRDAFPFALLEAAAALLVWLCAWAWLRRRPSLPAVLTFMGLAFMLVLFVSRYFHDSHLVLAAELAAAGLFSSWAQRSLAPRAGPYLTGARPRR